MIRQAVTGFRRWITDPRTGLALAVGLLTAAVISFVILSGLTARDALDTRDRTEAEASRRIDRLQDEIALLREQLVEEVRAGSSRIGELTDQISVLQAQVRQLGGDPVIQPSTTGTTAPRRAPPTTTEPRRPPTTTPHPTTTTTPPDRGLCVLVVCIGGTPWPSTVNPRSSSAPSTRSSRSPSASASTSPPNKSASSTPR